MCQEDETVDQYVAQLCRVGQNWEFPELDDCRRDQLADWCRSLPIRQKFLEKGSALTLTNAQMIARMMEAVELQSASIAEAKPAKAEVNQIESREMQQPSARGGPRRCYRCGKEGHLAKDGKRTAVTQRVQML